MAIYLFFMYFIQHCFICHPTDSTVSEDAGIEPRTAILTLAVRRSNYTWLDLIHSRLDPIHNSAIDLIHPRLDLIHKSLDDECSVLQSFCSESGMGCPPPPSPHWNREEYRRTCERSIDDYQGRREVCTTPDQVNHGPCCCTLAPPPSLAGAGGSAIGWPMANHRRGWWREKMRRLILRSLFENGILVVYDV